MSSLRRFLFRPVLAALLKERVICVIIVLVTIAHVVLSYLHLPGWTCPMYASTGQPCPGCGLTRAVLALLHGDVKTMLAYHAYAPMLAVGLTLIFLSAVLPNGLRQKLVAGVHAVETHTALTMIMLLTFVLYYIVRMVTSRQELLTLLAS